MATTNKEREMRVGVDRIVGFAKQFDEAHLNLACHAAFPLVLTPDLLYQIWAHFVPEAPWTAVARVLLSRLCRQVGYEMYEMDIAVRNLLLKELKEQFGQERLDDLAEFLLEYVAQRLSGDDPDTQDLREAQEWTALAYTKPDEAARELVKALSSSVKQKDMVEVCRIASLVETFAEPLKESGFEPLVIYAGGMADFARSNLEGEEIEGNNQITAVKVSLPIPEQIQAIQAEHSFGNLVESLEQVKSRQEGRKLPCAVILTAIRVEYKAVRAHLTDPQEEENPEGKVYQRGIFSAYGRSWEVGIVRIGPGGVNAAVETKRALDYFKPSVLLFVGVAGGIKDVNLGDVVVATKVYGYESGKVEETFLARPNVSRVSFRLEQRAMAEADKDDWLQRIKGPIPTPEPKVEVGAIAAGEKVLASTNSDVFRLLRSHYNDALAVEMEGHGFLEAVRANKEIDALIIRGISDLIDGKSDADATGSQETAARHASAFAFEVLAKLGGDAEVTVEPGPITKELEHIPETNSNRSFIVDRLEHEDLSSGRRVYSFDVYNQGYADGVVEVRNARNELIEFRGIEGIRIPTGIFNFGIQSIERLWRLATEGYDFLDPRNSLGNSQKTEIRDLVVPSGGRLKITKKGDKALIYNQATFLMRLFFDSEFFLGDSPLVKARLLSALCEKLQQEHIGSLVKDDALMTQSDALQALINGSWINKENLDKLTRIGLQALAEQGLKGIAGIVINEQVLGRSLGFWVTAAEGFVKGTNVFLQWLDLDRSQRAEEENVTLFIN